MFQVLTSELLSGILVFRLPLRCLLRLLFRELAAERFRNGLSRNSRTWFLAVSILGLSLSGFASVNSGQLWRALSPGHLTTGAVAIVNFAPLEEPTCTCSAARPRRLWPWLPRIHRWPAYRQHDHYGQLSLLGPTARFTARLCWMEQTSARSQGGGDGAGWRYRPALCNGCLRMPR